MQSTRLYIYDDVANSQDDFHLLGELVNVRDMRFLYSETYVINGPSGAGDGYTASEIGFKIFLWWQVFFTDGTEQTYLAIVHLRGDSCEGHGWDDSLTTNTKCVDLDA